MRYILSLTLLFSLHFLSAQTEINVKLKPQPSPLNAYFQQNKSKHLSATARNTQNKLAYNFLSKLAYIQPLQTSAKAENLRNIFTLHFEEGDKNMILNELMYDNIILPPLKAENERRRRSGRRRSEIGRREENR